MLLIVIENKIKFKSTYEAYVKVSMKIKFAKDYFKLFVLLFKLVVSYKAQMNQRNKHNISNISISAAFFTLMHRIRSFKIN